MANKPLNLALRFMLEIAALASIGYWGWNAFEGVLRVAMTIGLPLCGAIIWAVFRVDNDPKDAPVAVPGLVRLAIEITLLMGGSIALYFAGAVNLSWVLAALITIQYLISYQRIRWLVKQ